ncbi:MAG: molybdate ABC transporter substrate-binding protein [Gallionella sp.]
MLKKYFLGIVFCCLLISNTRAETLTVAAAADLSYCLPELAKTFQALNPGSEIKTVFGASGSLFAQIKNGAPYDVFMSADMQYPGELANAGAADKSSLMSYATGHLVLWTANPNINLDNGLAGLKQQGIRHIAIANPDAAPYGRAARAAFQQAGVWEDVKPRLVFGDNIAQAMQFAETGNADVAVLSRALVLTPKMAGKGHAQPIPETLYPAINQGLIITNRGMGNTLSVKFVKFIQTEKAQEMLRQFGFSTPKPTKD